MGSAPAQLVICKAVEAGNVVALPMQTNVADARLQQADPDFYLGHKPHISYGNLRTVDEFRDFNLKLEVNVPTEGNSGIYLRGIYEVQVNDSYGKEPGWNGMGAIYSRIVPDVKADKTAGQWQKMDITLVDRHVTVKLNDVLIIDNKPLLGCTGGAIWSDEFRAGPIYLQGDHTGMLYRNIVLKPVVKK